MLLGNRSMHVNTGEGMCGKLLIGYVTLLAIFNSVVEIYKPLIQIFHTSTLMALA